MPYDRRARGLRAAALVAGVSAVVSCTTGSGTKASPSPSGFSPPPRPLTTVEPGALEDVGTTTWQSATRVGDRTLDIDYLGAPNRCRVLANVRVAESASEVRVTLFLGTPPENAGRTCSNLGIPVRTRVPLDAPVGDRRVVDAGATPPAERPLTP